jgi:hypothetical protein
MTPIAKTSASMPPVRCWKHLVQIEADDARDTSHRNEGEVTAS